MRARRQRLSTAIALGLLVAAFVMMALGLAGVRRPEDLWEPIFAPETEAAGPRCASTESRSSRRVLSD